MKILFIILILFAFTAQFAFAQCEDCPAAIVCDQAEAPDFTQTMRILTEITDEYAYYKSDTKADGYTSSYQFRYDEENQRGVFVFTTMVYKAKPVFGNREYSQRDMVPDKHLEYEYIFNFADFDSDKSEIVSWEDEAGKMNLVMTQAMAVEDPSQKYDIDYPYFRVTLHTRDDDNLITVHSVEGDSKGNSISLYFQDKYYADEFIDKFDHAVKLRQEKSSAEGS